VGVGGDGDGGGGEGGRGGEKRGREGKENMGVEIGVGEIMGRDKDQLN
jgi:hypothetical protein